MAYSAASRIKPFVLLPPLSRECIAAVVCVRRSVGFGCRFCRWRIKVQGVGRVVESHETGRSISTFDPFCVASVILHVLLLVPTTHS